MPVLIDDTSGKGLDQDEILARDPVQDAGQLVPGVMSASDARTATVVHKQLVALTGGLSGAAGRTAQVDPRQ